MKRKKQKKQKGKIIGLVVIIVFVAVVAYFIVSSRYSSDVPAYVTGEMREMYEWVKTPIGMELMEQVPCYCGCKFEGHLHARHCFWRDDGTFDTHGITCSGCFDVGKKTKEMYEDGKDICYIRKEIDAFYAPNADLATETPMPEGCVA